MKKLDIKTKDNYSKDEMKKYLGALSETHNSGLKAVKEGFQIINRKLDNQEKILNTHTEILNKHEKILNSHTEMIGNIMEDVSILKEDVSILKEDVSMLKDDMQIVKKELKKKVDYDEFMSLVQRVNKLESKI